MFKYIVLAKNRISPSNEDDYIHAFNNMFPNISKDDGLDISAVTTNDSVVGHALMHQSNNRARDTEYHTCYLFVSDDELEHYM